ncbi:MAG: GC-type dockerin domain-anchored protein [Phycisphaerales bacterium]
MSTSPFRGEVAVLDVSDPEAPIEITRITTGGAPQRFTIRGSTLYLAAGSVTFRAYDIEDPRDTTQIGSYLGSGFGYAVDVIDDLGYVASGVAGLDIIQLDLPRPVRLGIADTPGEARDVLIRDGLAFIADGLAGLSVVDVSDPANPTLITSVDTPALARGIALGDNHAFVADGRETPDSGGGVEIFDISTPTAPVLVASYIPDLTVVDVRVEDDTLYAATDAGRIDIVDVSDPSNPRLLGQYSSVARLGAIDVEEGLVYAATLTAGFQILDIRKPASSPLVGVAEFDEGLSQTVFDGQMAYAVSRDTGIRIFDLSDPEQPVERATLAIDDLEGGVAIDGQTLYVSSASFATSSFSIIAVDVSDSSNPIVINETPSAAVVLDLVARDGVLYAPSASEGLIIYDTSDPGNLEVLSDVDVELVTRIALDGSIAYAKGGDTFDDARVFAIDVADPTAPSVLGQATVDGFANDLEVVGPGAVATVGERFSIINFEDPASPFVANVVDQPTGSFQALARRGNLLLAAGGGPAVYDVREPFDPRPVGRFAIERGTSRVSFLGEFGAANGLDGRIYIVDLEDCCPADLDGDGVATVFDFLAFQNLFQDEDPRADLDGDGSFTLFDFLAFQDVFDAGCP